MTLGLLAAGALTGWELFLQQCLNGVSYGALVALVALGYTMVYGIIGLINFAHGDLFMLGTFLTLSLIELLLGTNAEAISPGAAALALLAILPLAALFCGALNLAVDRVVYRPLRNAPKLTALVSAIGVSFVFQNIGQLWKGTADLSVPKLISQANLLGDSPVTFTVSDLVLIVLVAAIMAGLTYLVKFTRMGKAMRATSQDPLAAQLMGIDVERVIGATFVLGGALAGFAAVILSMQVGSTKYQIGYTVGLVAFTAAVLGGIGNIPGAVLGGFLIGMVRSLGIAYWEERWVDALIFGILIVILVFRPSGLLGDHAREKV